jgi:hypothetical protein
MIGMVAQRPYRSIARNRGVAQQRQGEVEHSLVAVLREASFVLIHYVIRRGVDRRVAAQPSINRQLDREGECLLAPAGDKSEDEELPGPECSDVAWKIVIGRDKLIKHIDGLHRFSVLYEGGHTLPVLLLGLRLSFGDPSPQLVRTLLNPPAHLLDCIDCVDQFPGNHLSERFVELPGERPARAAPRMNMPDSNFGAGLP